MAATATESTTATSTTSDGPVLSVISKRLRALRKKHNRIVQMEDSAAQGKTLNKEQQEVLRSKSAVLVAIDELEKLRAPLAAALDEELSLSPAKAAPEPEKTPVAEADTEQQQPQDGGDDAKNTDGGAENGGGSGDDERIDDVVKLLVSFMYFGNLFDVNTPRDAVQVMSTRMFERNCCLTYDIVTDDATDPLYEHDLDSISELQGLINSRPARSNLSHQNALEMCFRHASRLIANSDQPYDPHCNVTYAALREKLEKIMSSNYITATPNMRQPEELAAEAAVGNFGSFHQSMVNSAVHIEVEASPEQYQEKEENTANYEEYETSEHQSGNKDELEPENPPEVVSAQRDQEQYQNAEGEHGYRNVDSRDQQYASRRGQRGGRGGGGGRRGYSNGRGGRGTGRGNGPYQNGRNQYNDNYYPRNNHYNNRRGRGGAGGGGGYYNNSSGGQGNYSQADVGVES